MIFPNDVTLAMMTKMAIEILSKNPNGFFLMVEGGQIDWFSHDNDAENTIATTREFDGAVTEADLYAIDHPDTLIIVTADHETGGMSLNLDGSGNVFKQDGPFSMVDGTQFWVDWSTGGHTAVDVPVTAQGPWSELLYGTYPNTWIYWVMYSALTGELPGGN
jgi:alkaline phosphatase